MSPRSQESPRSLTATEARILESARQLFIKRGLSAVNMDLIARTARVARQTLYNRFGSKDAVFRASLDAHWAALDAAASQHLDADKAPVEVLARVASDVLAFIGDRDQVAMTRMVIAESRLDPDLARTFFERGKKPLLARFSHYLRAASSVGTLNCPDPELAAKQFLGMIQESLLWPRVMGLDKDTHDEATVVTGAISVFLNTYAAREQGGSSRLERSRGTAVTPVRPATSARSRRSQR